MEKPNALLFVLLNIVKNCMSESTWMPLSFACLLVGCKKVGVTGFCMGGALSLASAALIPEEISAAAPFYGIPSSELCDVGKIKIPVQAHFGSKDHIVGFSSAKDAEALKQKLDAGGVNYELYMYDTGHSFTNPTSESYTKEICNLALGRMVEFMKKHLAWALGPALSVNIQYWTLN